MCVIDHRVIAARDAKNISEAWFKIKMAAINSLIDWEYSDEEYEYNNAVDDKLDFKVDDVEKMKQEIEETSRILWTTITSYSLHTLSNIATSYC